MTELLNQGAITEYLSDFISENKKDRMEEVLGQRTRHLTVVLEDIFKPHNASAVLRTCECFGIQDVHIVEQRNSYDVNPYVTRGSAKWLTIHKYDHPNHHNIETCFEQLRKNKYQIVATSPIGTQTIKDIPIDRKTALVFGTEETGISQYIEDNADNLVQIPMYGFTESFNISVSAAILLETFVERLKMSDTKWELTNTEKNALKFEWYKGCIKHSEALINVFEQKSI